MKSNKLEPQFFDINDGMDKEERSKVANSLAYLLAGPAQATNLSGTQFKNPDSNNTRDQQSQANF